MRIDFLDLDRYCRNPPGLKEMMGGAQDCRGKKHGDVLVIIGSHHDNARLKKLLDALALQNFRNFDVAVIYAKEDKFVHNVKLPILHVRRKTELGFAGALYLGQLVALRDRYKYYLATDVDKYPYSRNSLESLYNKAETGDFGYVRGRFLFDGLQCPPDKLKKLDRKIAPGWLFSLLWSLVRTDTLCKTGLYPLPFYLGADDIEFGYRLSSIGIRQAALEEIIFTTYYPVLRLWQLIAGGTSDRTYLYARVLSIIQMPEIFFLQFSFKSFIKNLENVAFFALPHVFTTCLFMRMLEARAPEFAQYSKMAKKGRFAYPRITGMRECADITPWPRPKKNDAVVYTRVTAQGVLRTFALLANKSNIGIRADFQMVLPDWYVVIDDYSGKAYRVTWKKRLGLPHKFLIMLLAGCDTAAALIKSAWNIAAGRHKFFGYGLSIVRETEGAKGAQKIAAHKKT